jgi:hypothetical protein
MGTPMTLVYSRWLPVTSLVSPDGTHYVFMDSTANLSTVVLFMYFAVGFAPAA